MKKFLAVISIALFLVFSASWASAVPFTYDQGPIISSVNYSFTFDLEAPPGPHSFIDISFAELEIELNNNTVGILNVDYEFSYLTDSIIGSWEVPAGQGAFTNTWDVVSLFTGETDLLNDFNVSFSVSSPFFGENPNNSDLFGASLALDGTAVPVPAAVWLLGSGLIGLLGLRRKMR
jgi:hypothetical protein